MRNIPNILSAFRIILIPFFVWQMMAGNMAASAVILVISGVSDMLDGFLARRFGWITQLGKFLDPAADKLTLVAVCGVLAKNFYDSGSGFWFMFLILIAKEAVMLFAGGYMVKKRVKMEGSKWYGKVVTVLFYVTVVAIVLFPGMAGWLKDTLLTVTVLAALFAAAMYVPDFLQYLKDVKKHDIS